MSNKIESILFVGSLVPDASKFKGAGFSQAGNLAQMGIVEGLCDTGYDVEALSIRPIQAWPRHQQLFCKGASESLKHKCKILIFPLVNIAYLKMLWAIVYEFIYIIIWTIRKRKCKRFIMTYNIYMPPIYMVYCLGKLTNSKTVTIIFDIGKPSKSLSLGFFKEYIYLFCDYIAKFFIPKLDGRIIINERIKSDFAPKSHCLVVDGGVTEATIRRLFKLKISKDANTVFLCAGALNRLNGIDIILDALHYTKNSNIRMFFAGVGVEVENIKQFALKDTRVQYLGYLDSHQLFDLYEKIDVLLNIRATNNREAMYCFPSKLLEYLVVGKYVVSTNVAHTDKMYGQYCLILHNENPETLARTMDNLTQIDKSLLYEKGMSARAYMLSTHTWKMQCVKIQQYLIEIS